MNMEFKRKLPIPKDMDGCSNRSSKYRQDRFAISKSVVKLVVLPKS